MWVESTDRLETYSKLLEKRDLDLDEADQFRTV